MKTGWRGAIRNADLGDCSSSSCVESPPRAAYHPFLGGVLGLGSYRSKRDEVFAGWSSSIKALAARPNVFVKLGGLGQRYTSLRFDEDAEPPTSEMVAARFRPYIETCIAAFGTSRCMFESNFPVDKISYSYHVFWNACKLMAKGASSTEKADLFGGAAARCYRLNVIG